MPTEIKTLMNQARCYDSCIPTGVMSAILIQQLDELKLRGILGEASQLPAHPEYIYGEGGEIILEENP